MGLLKDSQQKEISLQRALPVDDIGNASVVKSVSAETVQLYYYNAGVLTADAGQAAGTLVVAKLTYDNILSKIGDVIGGSNDTSFSLANANTFDAEVLFPYRDAELKDTETAANKALEIGNSILANGQYCIDYRTGMLYGRKKNTGTTVSASYKYSSDAITIETGDINIGNVGLLNAAEVEINPATEEKQDDIVTVIEAVETNQTDGSQKTQIVDDLGGVITSFGSPSTIASHKSPKDFTATYTSNVTITLSGLPFTITDSSQLVYIKIIPATGDAQVLVNGSGGVTMNISSNVITVSGAGTPFASGDVYEVGINDQDKAYDPSTNSQMVSPLKNVWNQYTDAEVLVTAQDLTGSYADFGSEIDMRGYTHLRVGIVLDVNDSTNITLKLLGLNESGGSDEFEIEGGLTQAIAHTADAKFSYEFDVKGSPFIQLQAIAGTVGATAGDLTLSVSKQFKV